MRRSLTVDGFIERLKLKKLTGVRTGQNVQYEVNDAALAGFAIFFMQSASFLAGQRHLRQAKGQSNAETVFKMERIPTDTHIRNLLMRYLIFPDWQSLLQFMFVQLELEPD